MLNLILTYQKGKKKENFIKKLLVGKLTDKSYSCCASKLFWGIATEWLCFQHFCHWIRKNKRPVKQWVQPLLVRFSASSRITQMFGKIHSSVSLELMAGREPFPANRMLVHLLNSTITKGEIKGRGQGPKSLESSRKSQPCLFVVVVVVYWDEVALASQHQHCFLIAPHWG